MQKWFIVITLSLSFLAIVGSQTMWAEAKSASGDFNNDGFDDLVIGAQGGNVNGKDSAGEANVIYGSANGLHKNAGFPNQRWHQDKTGIAGKAEAGDLFGWASAIGDFNNDNFDDLAIGVPGEAIGSDSNAGAVNVVYGSSTGLRALAGPGDQIWHQDSPGIAGGVEPFDRFGEVLTSGDFNGDNFDDLAVGVPFEGIGGDANAGAVNVIYGSANGLTSVGDQIWHQDKAGIAGATEPNDNFGDSLTTGDFNNDGFDDLAIGVPGESIGTIINAGAVNVIYGSASGLHASAGNLDQIWHQNKASILGVVEANDLFGFSVRAGDFNNDGFDDLAIGVPGENIGTIINAGQVNVIYGSVNGLHKNAAQSNNVWHQNKASILGVAEAQDRFGDELAVADFNNDNFDDLAIGVQNESVFTIGLAGAANIIYGSANGLHPSAGNPDQVWHQDKTGIFGIAEDNDRFASQLGVGDFNNDGFDDAAFGVEREDLAAPCVVGDRCQAGQVNVIYGSLNGLHKNAAHSNQVWHQDKGGILGIAEANDNFARSLP